MSGGRYGVGNPGVLGRLRETRLELERIAPVTCRHCGQAVRESETITLDRSTVSGDYRPRKEPRADDELGEIANPGEWL